MKEVWWAGWSCGLSLKSAKAISHYPRNTKSKMFFFWILICEHVRVKPSLITCASHEEMLLINLPEFRAPSVCSVSVRKLFFSLYFIFSLSATSLRSPVPLHFISFSLALWCVAAHFCHIQIDDSEVLLTPSDYFRVYAGSATPERFKWVCKHKSQCWG